MARYWSELAIGIVFTDDRRPTPTRGWRGVGCPETAASPGVVPVFSRHELVRRRSSDGNHSEYLSLDSCRALARVGAATAGRRLAVSFEPADGSVACGRHRRRRDHRRRSRPRRLRSKPMSSPLERVSRLGQSVWIDWLSRDLLSSGGLKRLIAEHAVTGVTTNPTILERAIAAGHGYDRQIADLLAFDLSPREIATELARTDVSEAALQLLPLWQASGGRDGYDSL